MIEMTYSLDLRERILSLRLREGMSYTKLSKLFGINRQTIFRWTKRDNLSPSKNRKKECTKINMKLLVKDIKERPDAYNYERAERLDVSVSCMH